MYRVPDIAAVQAAAAHLGVTLTDSDAAVYQKHLATTLGEYDEFVQARSETARPPRFPGAREPGYRPGPDEDSYFAWMWKCEIPGTSDGLLAGKQVSYKDHIAVAGVRPPSVHLRSRVSCLTTTQRLPRVRSRPAARLSART